MESRDLSNTGSNIPPSFMELWWSCLLWAVDTVVRCVLPEAVPASGLPTPGRLAKEWLASLPPFTSVGCQDHFVMCVS